MRSYTGRMLSLSVVIPLLLLTMAVAPTVAQGNRTVVDVDMVVNKADSPDPVTAGSTLTYTLTVTNLGTDPAVGVTLTDHLPDEVSFVSATPAANCSFDDTSRSVTCEIGDLGGETSTTIIIAAIINSAPAEGMMLINEANVAAANEPDNNIFNNTVTEGTAVIAPMATPTPVPVPTTTTAGTIGLIIALGLVLSAGVSDLIRRAATQHPKERPEDRG